MGQNQSTSTPEGLDKIRKNNQPANLKNRIVPNISEKKPEIKVMKQNYVGNVNSDFDNGYVEKNERKEINMGLNNHQYFKAIPEKVTNIKEYVGVNSKKDPRFQQNIGNLYNAELNNRDFDDNNDVSYNTVVSPVYDNQQTSHVPIYSENHQNTGYNHNYVENENNPTEITISREDALVIRDITAFTNLDKRLLIMNSITLDKIDPINVIKDNPNITLDSLSQKYISLRNIYHPDKGGSSEMFSLVNEALKKQLHIIKSRVIDKDYNELKRDFNDYGIKKKKPLEFSNKEILDTDRFSVKKFNKFFDDNRYGDDFDNNGYEEIMTKSGIREDIDIENTITSFNSTKFNNIFNESKDNVDKQIVKYHVPQPIQNTSHFKELGKKAENYTSSQGNIQYCDYRDAYTRNNIMNVGKVNTKQYKNLEDLEIERKNDKLELSDEQYRKIEEIEKRDIDLENERLENIDQFDKALDIHYNRINKLMLQ